MSLDAFAARFPGRSTAGLTAGVDVSGWQSTTIWPTLPWARWAALKVSEGTGFVEPSWPAHLAAARAQGVLCLPYHFARPDRGTQPEAEAAVFSDQVARAEWQGRAVLDLEAGSGNLDDWTLRFLAETHRRVGAQIGGPRADLYATQAVYTARWFADGRLTSRELDRFGRWVAQYPAAGDLSAPVLPAVWSDWDAWQWTSSFVQPNLDVNVLAHPLRMLTATTEPLEADLTPEETAMLRAVYTAVVPVPPGGSDSMLQAVHRAVVADGPAGQDSIAWRTYHTLTAAQANVAVQQAILDAVRQVGGPVTVDVLRRALVAALRDLAAGPVPTDDPVPQVMAVADPGASTFDAGTARLTSADVRYRNHGGRPAT